MFALTVLRTENSVDKERRAKLLRTQKGGCKCNSSDPIKHSLTVGLRKKPSEPNQTETRAANWKPWVLPSAIWSTKPWRLCNPPHLWCICPSFMVSLLWTYPKKQYRASHTAGGFQTSSMWRKLIYSSRRPHFLPMFLPFWKAKTPFCHCEARKGKGEEQKNATKVDRVYWLKYALFPQLKETFDLNVCRKLGLGHTVDFPSEGTDVVAIKSITTTLFQSHSEVVNK